MNPWFRFLEWAVVILVALLLFMLLSSASSADVLDVQIKDGKATMPEESFAIILNTLKQQQRLLERETTLANFYKDKFDTAEACARDNAKNDKAILPCFNRKVPQVPMEDNDKMHLNTDEF